MFIFAQQAHAFVCVLILYFLNKKGVHGKSTMLMGCVAIVERWHSSAGNADTSTMIVWMHFSVWNAVTVQQEASAMKSQQVLL